MRSVVVVLPASMWAMIPMLRVRASGYSRISKTFPALPFDVLFGLCHFDISGIFSAGLAI